MTKTMNKIAFILMIMALPSLVSGQDKKAKKHNLKSTTVYEQKYEKGNGGKTLKESETRYDDAGNIIEEISYQLGKVDKHFLYEYDKDNNKIRETELDASGKKIKVTEYKYSDGLRMERTVYNGNNQVLSKKTYKCETF